MSLPSGGSVRSKHSRSRPTLYQSLVGNLANLGWAGVSTGVQEVSGGVTVFTTLALGDPTDLLPPPWFIPLNLR